ncbi:MAG: tetratricopeptide repeat protein [Sneathiella sp.]|nr:tetratricopeptide repeat protein [Sneathiella sp.]
MKYIKIVTFIYVVLFFSIGSVAARQDDQRLEPLFENLLNANNRVEAEVIEQSIWQIWLSSESDTVDLLMFQAVHQMMSGGFKQAAFLFTAIIEMDPLYAEAWNKRATVRFLLGDLEGSLADVGKTLELEQRHFGALAGLGHIYERLEQYDKALQAFEKAIELNPHMPVISKKIQYLRIKLEARKA